MKSGKLIAIAAAALFAAPLATYAAGDEASTSGATSASEGKSSDNGAEAMFKSLDKNNDGYLSKEEVQGTPHEQAFSTLDKDGDGKLSPEEHAAAPEHAGSASSAGSSSAPSDSSSGASSSGGGKKY